jgi:hypothetical protein
VPVVFTLPNAAGFLGKEMKMKIVDNRINKTSIGIGDVVWHCNKPHMKIYPEVETPGTTYNYVDLSNGQICELSGVSTGQLVKAKVVIDD